MNLLPYLFICLAAICNAVMDRVEYSTAFNQSIFKWKDKEFWEKDISWQYAKKIFGWKADAWHIAKSLMIIFLITAVIVGSVGKSHHWWEWFIMGVVWNLVFNLFYNKILKA